MPTQRGLVPPAIIGSTIVLILCAMSWAALGVLTIDDTVPIALHRFLTMLVATVTICSVIVHLTARALRSILAAIAAEAQTVCGYVEGYTDGVNAAPVSPGVSRLVPSRH